MVSSFRPRALAKAPAPRRRAQAASRLRACAKAQAKHRRASGGLALTWPSTAPPSESRAERPEGLVSELEPALCICPGRHSKCVSVSKRTDRRREKTESGCESTERRFV